MMDISLSVMLYHYNLKGSSNEGSEDYNHRHPGDRYPVKNNIAYYISAVNSINYEILIQGYISRNEFR